MSVTFVSAYLNLNESRPHDKPLQQCFRLFKNVVDTGIPIHLFLSNDLVSLFHDHVGNPSNVTIETIELTDLDTYRDLEGITYSLPVTRHATHDSAKFMILMNAKVEFLRRTITSGRYTTTHFAWIDFNICHIFKDISKTCEYLKDIADSTPCPTLLTIPGSWKRGQYADDLFTKVNWRYSGGFFLGDKHSLLSWDSAYRSHFKNIIRNSGVLVWETNIWHLLELNGLLEPNWYAGSHDDGIIKVPYSNFLKIATPSIDVIPVHNSRIYWDAHNSRCHVGKDIQQFIEHIICKRKYPVSVIIGTTDGILGTKEYNRMISARHIKGVNNASESEYAEWESRGKVGTYPIMGVLCSRQFSRPNMLYMPLDDDIFRDGLEPVLAKQGVTNVPWELKHPVVFWRGGASGFDQPFLRQRVVTALHGKLYADVALTHNSWPENNALIPPHLFGDCVPPSIQTHYKYLLVIDGACIASNHMWVFGTGSVPIIISHPDNNYWFKKFLKPMVNYVPIAYDLSDLTEKIKWLIQNDDAAKRIADAALVLSKEIFTPEFQRAYIESEIETIIGKKYNRIGFDTVYARKCYTPGDINQHLPILREYAAKCSRIVECGVLNSVSSYAFATALVGKPDNYYYMVDPYRNTGMDEFLIACKREGIKAEFHHGSDLTCPRVNADLVFIDTWHIYAQLKRELEYWHEYAGKYIIMHDTTVDEWDGESIRGRFDLEKQSHESGWPVEEIGKGLWPAVEEFLESHPEWELERRLVNNNGLTILRKRI